MAFRETMGTLPDTPGKLFKEPGARYVMAIINGNKIDAIVDPAISRLSELTQAHDLDQRVIIQRIRIKQENSGT
jgi:hypothetical protein